LGELAKKKLLRKAPSIHSINSEKFKNDLNIKFVEARVFIKPSQKEPLGNSFPFCPYMVFWNSSTMNPALGFVNLEKL
jgi:hypothetical protein